MFLSHEVYCYIPATLHATSYFLGFLLSICVWFMIVGILFVAAGQLGSQLQPLRN
jgi:hypothetical protein